MFNCVNKTKIMNKLKYFIILFSVMIMQFISQEIKAQTSGLLSDTVDVTKYEIHLEVANFSMHNINGFTKVMICPRMNNLQFIPLQLWSLNVDSVVYDTIPLDITDVQYDGMDLRIPVQGAFSIGDTVALKIYYHGSPQHDPTGWGGFLFESSMAYNLGVGFGADPHNLGKTWFPCVDDFIDRATYEYYIKTDANKMAVCGGTLYDSYFDPSDSTKIIYHWGLDLEIPTYLASIAVSNYSAVLDTFHGIERDIPIGIYVQSAYLNSVSASFVNLKPSLESYEERFGAYAWPRVGYVGTTVGAMEHVSNIAFPTSYINGSTTGETTMAHELSHMWFGDLITCSSSGDMWINEGWASFCEFVFKEDIHGIDVAKDYIRHTHANNLRLLEYSDGLIPLTDVDHEHTYSTTVYKKGADVIHSLRGYLGDDVFFPAVRGVLQDYAFEPISTEEFRDALSSHSSVDLTSFFNDYLYEPGWTHFSIDSFTIVPAGSNFDVTVYVRQRLKDKPQFANDNRIDVTFMDDSWQAQTSRLYFSGEFGQQTFSLPFAPAIAMLDLEENFSDATTDYYQVYTETGNSTFSDTYCKFQVQQITDSVFFRVEHNWVAPDCFSTEHPEYTISDSRYWKIDGIFPFGFQGQLGFYYNNKENNDGWLDYTWFPYPMSADSLTLLYRSSTADEWQEINVEKVGTSRTGWLLTDFVQRGEYTMAYRNLSLSNHKIQSERNTLNVFPNPVNDLLNVRFNIKRRSNLYIIDSSAKQISKTKISKSDKQLTIDVSTLPIGVYFVEIKNSRSCEKQKFIISR